MTSTGRRLERLEAATLKRATSAGRALGTPVRLTVDEYRKMIAGRAEKAEYAKR
jgi:hypothetical protein